MVEELQRLKGLYEALGTGNWPVSSFIPRAYRITTKRVQQLWQQLRPAAPRQLPLLDYHSYPERAQARLEVITLYVQGWSKRSISQFLHVSRPTINAWIDAL